MSTDVFIDELSRRLSQLDSLATKPNSIIGYPRPSADQARAQQPPAKESAVLFPIFKRFGQWHTVFIKRPSGDGVHSDQLSFPGGRLELNETHKQAALRETHEEIGVAVANWQLLGELSTLYIPPSHFVVQPFVACCFEEPVFHPNPAEVDRLIEFPLEALLQPGLVKRKPILVKTFNRTFDSGYFDIDGHVLWGATAIMVQEFRSLFDFHD
ncbi:MAG: NUDIX hydrolase [Flavobacteriales bacterium]|jgi:8-oxo-dGTP pyrophosphatase MutT (NUDIX family)